MADYKHITVNQDVQYIRDRCPQTISTVTGNGPGMVCRCDCPPVEPPTPPAPSRPKCCQVNIVVGNLKRYRVSSANTQIKVCC